MAFLKYPHLEKYGNTEVEGIEFGITHVFPKLDGTNGSVWLEDGLLRAGSRNRVLSVESDNQGFLNEGVIKNTNLVLFFEKYPNYILYGEWLVKHSISYYRDTAWRKFYIFDVYDKATEKFLSYDEYQPLLEAFSLIYIPCIKKFKNGTQENFLIEAKTCKYLLEDDNPATGEGVVIKNYEWQNKFNRVTWAKIILAEFKEQHLSTMGANLIDNITNEEKIAEIACTKSLIDKEYAKIVNEKDG